MTTNLPFGTGHKGVWVKASQWLPEDDKFRHVKIIGMPHVAFYKEFIWITDHNDRYDSADVEWLDESQYDDLLSEVTRLRGENEAMRKENEGLREDNFQMSAELSRQDFRIKYLEGENKKLHDGVGAAWDNGYSCGWNDSAGGKNEADLKQQYLNSL